MSDDPFDWHRRALAGEKPPIHDGCPKIGFYRHRIKDPKTKKPGPWLPASIFRVPDGTLVAEINGTEANPIGLWTYFAKNPVSEEAYRHHVENGVWPGEENPRAVIGGNKPPEELPLDHDPASANLAEAAEPAATDPELDAFMVQVEEQRTLARAVWEELKLDAKQAVADRAQNIADKLRILAKQINSLREERKAPYLAACRTIDEFFREPKDLPISIADPLQKRINAWVAAEKERRRAEAQAEADRQAAERRRLAEAEAERRRLEAEAAGPAEEAPPPPLPPEPEKPVVVETPKVLVGGGLTGRRSGGARKTVTARIVDQDAVYQHFKQNYDVIQLLQKLANQAIKKQPVPGCERDDGSET